MIDTTRLKGKIVEKGLNQYKMADIIGISRKTFYEKMSKGVFGSDEMDIMRKTLSLTNDEAIEIFFGKE